MRVLAFDTATAATAVALYDASAGLSVEARDDPAARERPRHTTRLMPLIAEVLDRAGGGWSSLDRIAVGVGPGTFTGLRIGVATARALAQGLGAPLVGVSTLEALAAGISMHAAVAAKAPRDEEPVVAADAPRDAGTVVAVIDARRREVFAAAWRTAGAGLGEQVLAPEAIAPDALARRLAELPAPVVALGPGAVEFRDQLERTGAVIPAEDSELHRVTATSHCRLASAVPARTHAEVSPQYLRLPDAEIARRAKTKP